MLVVSFCVRWWSFIHRLDPSVDLTVKSYQMVSVSSYCVHVAYIGLSRKESAVL